MKFIRDLKRTAYCGDLRAGNVGNEVNLMGWVDTRRDHGGLVFVDLRDREGLVQVVLDPSKQPTAVAKDVRNEYVIAVSGVVRKRPEGMANKRLGTGEIEVEATACEILSEARTPPFQVNDANVSEILRLKYRYLDIRSARLNGFLRKRHEITQLVRQVLNDERFIEVETPILYKSTPEGARDYLVPSRVNQGSFYALPQSPQTLKQLLMIGGMDRYYQIARCFRDEDLRADRQPEFTQVDIEMSFVDQEDVMAMNEKLLRALWTKFRGRDPGKIRRMTFQESMERFGNDKPDVRFGLELVSLAEHVAGSGFKLFEDALAKGGSVRGIGVPQGSEFTRAYLDKLTDLAKKAGAKGLLWIKADAEGKLTSPVTKVMDAARVEKLFRALCPDGKGVGFIVADTFEISCATLSALRLHLGRELKLIDDKRDEFLWIVDFPLLEFDPEGKRWVARHHPFTAPQDQYLEAMKNADESQFGKILAKAYDLVCNGEEIAGGSIRIHRSDVQDTMFRVLGLSREEAQEKFGFFLEALQYGTPPHGGIAWGMDRLVTILCNTEAIRDVIAFPKTAKATCLMSEAPGAVSRDQLYELGIRLAPSVESKISEGKAIEVVGDHN